MPRKAALSPVSPPAPVKTGGKGSRSLPVFVVRSGPKRGAPDLEAAFETKQEAIHFAANLHGLNTEEQRELAKALQLKLDRKWHGSETCAIQMVSMSPDRARRAFRGDLYA